MLKIWFKLIKDGKISAQTVVDADESLGVEKMLECALKEACYTLDLSNPIILKKNIKDMDEYRITKFLPESFLESVAFDKMEASLFEENSKKKKA